MIELLIIAGLAVLGWLFWKGKLKPLSKTPENKRAPSAHPASSFTSNPPAPSPNIPEAQQPEIPISAIIEAPEQTAEPAPQVPIATVVAEEPKTQSSKTHISTLPEDSILKRHYLAALQAEKEALSNPYPTDSVLRRHYDNLHKIASPLQSKTADDSETKQPQVAEQSASVVEADLPENSLAMQDPDQLRREIAAELPAPPTDSVLKRHYDSLLETKLQQRLSVK